MLTVKISSNLFKSHVFHKAINANRVQEKQPSPWGNPALHPATPIKSTPKYLTLNRNHTSMVKEGAVESPRNPNHFCLKS